ncbi:hypothetical protein O181_087219 [Austropuccinia psidii MF-1]|uniref:Uncharacterized protein n=1 Tax=Austropuccinia psidii MF-1 TaxID=1389203 RepID=A0A9Q3P177_9BASI|nr:hypothetical protein [Austropuccinia psidii MF-1]
MHQHQEAHSFQYDSVLNEEDMRKLYEAIEWHEEEATSSAIDSPGDAIMINIQTKLQRVFDGFSANALQRTDNMEHGLNLVGLQVYDCTIKNSKHPQIIQKKERQSKLLQASHQSQSELKEQSVLQDHHSFFTADHPFFISLLMNEKIMQI